MRKEEIKQAALTLFANNGFEGTSLADIAGVVGLKKQSIYSHFKDKDDLFLSIMKDAKSTEIDYYRAKLRDSDLSRPDLVLSSLLFGVKELYDTDEAYQFWLRYGFYPPKHLYEVVQADITENVLQMEHEFTNLFSNWMDGAKVNSNARCGNDERSLYGNSRRSYRRHCVRERPRKNGKENHSFMANFLERNYAKSFELEV